MPKMQLLSMKEIKEAAGSPYLLNLAALKKMEIMEREKTELERKLEKKQSKE